MTSALFHNEFVITVDRSLGRLFEHGGEWDQLLATSAANTVFLTSGWLRAWLETYGREANLLIPQIRKSGRLVAAAAFQESKGVIEFIGKGRSDYLDLVLSRELESDAASAAMTALLDAARAATEGFRCFVLQRVPVENGTPARLQQARSRYVTTRKGTELAPTMEMFAAKEKLAKKSLRRHEQGLQRLGQLRTDTFTCANDISPRLSEFFDQHVRRWNGTPYPSLFLDDKNREFYRRVTQYLDPAGWLRFTEVRLDGRLVAAHFGFFHANRFTWYKPTFDPELARYSPGEVLLKRLIERADAEEATEFDFTIGDEAFKRRFSTKVREIAQLHITDSRMRAYGLRMRLALARTLRFVLGTKLFERLKTFRASR